MSAPSSHARLRSIRMAPWLEAMMGTGCGVFQDEIASNSLLSASIFSFTLSLLILCRSIPTIVSHSF